MVEKEVTLIFNKHKEYAFISNLHGNDLVFMNDLKYVEPRAYPICDLYPCDYWILLMKGLCEWNT